MVLPLFSYSNHLKNGYNIAMGKKITQFITVECSEHANQESTKVLLLKQGKGNIYYEVDAETFLKPFSEKISELESRVESFENSTATRVDSLAKTLKTTSETLIGMVEAISKEDE